MLTTRHGTRSRCPVEFSTRFSHPGGPAFVDRRIRLRPGAAAERCDEHGCCAGHARTGVLVVQSMLAPPRQEPAVHRIVRAGGARIGGYPKRRLVRSRAAMNDSCGLQDDAPGPRRDRGYRDGIRSAGRAARGSARSEGPLGMAAPPPPGHRPVRRQTARNSPRGAADPAERLVQVVAAVADIGATTMTDVPPRGSSRSGRLPRSVGRAPPRPSSSRSRPSVGRQPSSATTAPRPRLRTTSSSGWAAGTGSPAAGTTTCSSATGTLTSSRRSGATRRQAAPAVTRVTPSMAVRARTRSPAGRAGTSCWAGPETMPSRVGAGGTSCGVMRRATPSMPAIGSGTGSTAVPDRTTTRDATGHRPRGRATCGPRTVSSLATRRRGTRLGQRGRATS